jgi:hypothetical protein
MYSALKRMAVFLNAMPGYAITVFFLSGFNKDKFSAFKWKKGKTPSRALLVM